MKRTKKGTAPASAAEDMAIGGDLMLGTLYMRGQEASKIRFPMIKETSIVSVNSAIDRQHQSIDTPLWLRQDTQSSCSGNTDLGSLTNWKRLKNSLGSVIRSLKKKLSFLNRNSKS